MVLTLIAVGVARHPARVRGDGSNLLIFDLVFVLACAIAGVLIYMRGRDQVDVALDVAIKVGFVLGPIHISNHLLESFGEITVRVARLALGAGHTLLMLALFAVAGSLSRQRTRSIRLAMLASLGCTLVGLLIALSFAISINLLFEQRALWACTKHSSPAV